MSAPDFYTTIDESSEGNRDAGGDTVVYVPSNDVGGGNDINSPTDSEGEFFSERSGTVEDLLEEEHWFGGENVLRKEVV